MHSFIPKGISTLGFVAMASYLITGVLAVSTPSFSVTDKKVCNEYTFKGEDPWGNNNVSSYKYYIAYGDSKIDQFAVKDVTDQLWSVDGKSFTIGGDDLATTINNHIGTGVLYVFGLVTKTEINIFNAQSGPAYTSKVLSSGDWVASFGTDVDNVKNAIEIKAC